MNGLKNLSEFQNILANYKISNAGQKLLGEVKLVLIIGPTSSGRNTIIKELVKTGRYRYIISDTTRQPRVNDGVLEQNGVEYWFRMELDVLDDLSKGKYLEAAIIHNQQVSGVSLREFTLARDRGQVAITDIEIVGLQTLIKNKPDTISIFLVPPSFAEWQARISKRGHMEPKELKRRLESACKEFQHALNNSYYYYLVSKDISQTMAQIQQLVNGGFIDHEHQKQNRNVIIEVLADTKNYLRSL